MIPYIDERLVDWARWSVSDGMEIRNSLGSRNCWPQMVRDPDSTDTVAQTGSLVPCNDIECAEMDEAVCSLPSELKSIIWDFYKRTVSGDQIAKRLGIGKRTLSAIEWRYWLHVAGIEAIPFQRRRLPSAKATK